MNSNDNQKPKSQPSEPLSEEAKEMNEMAKAFLVSLTWSLAGLDIPKKSPEPKPDAPQ